MSDLPPPSSSPDLPPPAPPERVAPAPAPLPPVVTPVNELPPPVEPLLGSDLEASTPEDKTMGIVMYLLPLLGLSVFSHANAMVLIVIAPLVLWLIKKDQSSYLNATGKEVVNFNICAVAVFLALRILWEIGSHLYLGWLFATLSYLVWLAWRIVTLIAAYNASNGKLYRFPFNYPIVK
ncbi:MAG: orotate phosphoribosyltransferase [Verrucomicrobiaceae bacterium]|nr:orotate phosphoribosyltransferase [Verrucomicrobiaceae bacterium]